MGLKHCACLYLNYSFDKTKRKILIDNDLLSVLKVKVGGIRNLIDLFILDSPFIDYEKEMDMLLHAKAIQESYHLFLKIS